MEEATLEQAHLKATVAVGRVYATAGKPLKKLWLVEKAPLGADTKKGLEIG